MNLRQLIEQYVTFRQTLGERFQTNAAILRAFGRALGAVVDIGEVSPERVNDFLAGTGPITSYWHTKHNALRGFYGYAVSRGYVATAPLPTVVPKRPPPFVPYIYSHEELRHLLQAPDSFHCARSSLEPVTVRSVVLLLYGTGLRVGEAVALNRADVNWEESLLTVHRTKFFKTRLVPFGEQLGHALAQYDARPQSPDPVPKEEAPFFTTRTGVRVKRRTLQPSFRRLCQAAGIRRPEVARYQPRLHDLRHSFAVHRLTSWYRQGADVQKLLPQLTVYLGHSHLASTQVYLSMTPDLLQEAAGRFARYAGEEGPHD
jgi:integrase/recombinase XerD